jgi:hypothetical protein
MSSNTSPRRKSAALLLAGAFLLQIAGPASARGYVFTYTVADMRQPDSKSGGSACPKPNRFNIAVTSGISRQWSTSLSTTPVTILTQDQTPEGRLNEVEGVIQTAFSMWTGVAGSALRSAAMGPLTRTATQTACAADGLNTICFNQNDQVFTGGVLAVTRVITSDALGEQPFPVRPPSSFIGEILDADVLLRPNDATTTFATPAALPSQPKAYDLESVLAHELGHFFGFGHSGVWRAMMYPFAPPPGQFLGDRPAPQAPDAPLAEDDRTAMRVLYPDPADTTHSGTISGRILPANPLSLPAAPAGVTGVFAAHVVAVDDATGAVIAGTMGGWSCSGPGPAQFDGFYILERLPVSLNQSYKIYVDPLDGPVDAGEISGSTAALCRNSITDPGWPPSLACRVPGVTTNFTTRTRPGP